VKVWWAAGSAGHFGKLVRLLLLTGCRRNEIAELRWSEITADAIELSGEQTKKSVAHTVTLTPTMRDVLATLPKDGKFVLRRPNYPDRPFTGFSKGKKQLQDGLASLGACGVRSRPAYNGSRYRHIIQLAINHRSGALGGIVKVSYRRRRHLQTGPTRIGPWSNSAWLIGV
jgi:integrase